MNNNNITFLRTYPAVPFSRFSLTTYPAMPLLIFFSLTLLYHFPAFRLQLTLLCAYLFYFHLPCCAIFPLFAYHLPCRAHTYFIFTYPALLFSLFSLIFYPAFPI